MPVVMEFRVVVLFSYMAFLAESRMHMASLSRRNLPRDDPLSKKTKGATSMEDAHLADEHANQAVDEAIAQRLNERAQSQDAHEADSEASTLDDVLSSKQDWYWETDENGTRHNVTRSAAEIEAMKDAMESVKITPEPHAWMRTQPLHVYLPRAAAEKVKKLVKIVMTIAHQRNEAPAVLTGGKQKSVDNQRYATDMLDRVLKNDKFTIQDLARLASMAALSQSAESAAANDAIVTATHLSMLIRGFRGEDYGTNYNYESSTPQYMVTYQGDLIREEKIQVEPWTEGVVQYCIAPDVSRNIKDLFKQATDHYTAAAPFLKFEDVGHTSGSSTSERRDQKCKKSPAIFVTSNDDYGCYAHRGMRKTMTVQAFQLHDPGCALVGTVVHMLGHALGMGHEHFAGSTGVRNKWVRNGRLENFKDFRDSPGDKVGHNPLSIMHIDPYAFAFDPRRPTLEGSGFKYMGQRVGLSKSDVDHLVRLYSSEGANESGLAGLGCYDDADACKSMHKPALWCSQYSFENCCACGGGTKVQCYKGMDCPVFRPGHFYLSVMRLGAFACILLVLLILAICLHRKPWKFYSRSADDKSITGASIVASGFGLGYGSTAGSKAQHFDISAESAEIDSAIRREACESGRQGCESGRQGYESGRQGHESGSSSQTPRASLSWMGPRPTYEAEGYSAAPISQDLLETTGRCPANRLSQEAYERFSGDFAPLAGGFSSGRSAPPAELIDQLVHPREGEEMPVSGIVISDVEASTADISQGEHKATADIMQEPNMATSERSEEPKEASIPERKDSPKDEENWSTCTAQ